MKKNTIRFIGASMAVLLLVTGCGKVPKLENGKDSVVTLKDSSISVDDLYTQMKDRYALSILLDMIDTEILNKKYVDDSTIKGDIEDQINLYIKQYGGESTLLQVLQNSGIYSIDEFRTILKLSYKRDKAVNDYAKSIVTEKEIQEYFDENYFGDISAKHILIAPKSDENATDAEKATAEEEALKTAKEVITKLNNGEDWDSLAKEYSSDEANKDNGGKLDDFNHGTMVSEFEEAAKKLEVGKYTTEPVKTKYGYHIIFKVAQKEKPQLKSVEDDIIDTLATTKKSEDSTIDVKALDALRKDNDVEIQDDTLKSQYERYIKNNTK